MTIPRVSVVMAACDAADHLREAVDSIRAQTLDDFELIVIDDGSRDETPAILHGVATAEPRLRIVRQENRGLVAALNRGLELARAPLVARMDADDIAHPSRLERQVEFLDAHPECVALGSRVMLVDPEGWPLRTSCDALEHAGIDAAHMQGRGGEICHPAAMLRASAVRKVGGYDPAMVHAEDIDLFLKLAEVGQLANHPHVLLRYRMHTRAIGFRHRVEQAERTLEAVRRAHQRRGLAEPAPRSVKAAPTRAGVHEKWAWWALRGGQVRSARKHALAAVRHAPFRRACWKVLACAVRGH